MSIVIYLIRRIKDNKFYIGQASVFKYKNGIPYRYGSKGRISDHISSESSIGKDIKDIGIQFFEIIDLCSCEDNVADEMEARYIDFYKSEAPNGYNTQKYSICEHRSETSIIEFYIPKLDHVSISAIQRNGQNKIARIYLYLKDRTQVRINIGSLSENFEVSYNKALKMLKPAFDKGINIKYSPSISGINDEIDKYSDKLQKYEDIVITKIRITLHKTKWGYLVVILIRTPETKSWKDEDKICFGGKTIPLLNSIQNAIEFVNRLDVHGEIVISPEIRSRQQAAASKGESSPCLENSVNDSRET